MTVSPPSREHAASDPWRVMVVEDTAVIRGLLTRILEADGAISVVKTANDGQMAVSLLHRDEIDVVVLDIEMPRMDGLTALPLLMAKDPGIRIIMASTLTRKNAEISMMALAAGAADYVAKPTSSSGVRSNQDFSRELVEKVKALGQARRGVRPGPPAKIAGRRSKPAETQSLHPGQVKLRRRTKRPQAAVLAIGSSTGGPQALISVLGALGKKIRMPILVTQHMPPTFTTILAHHLGRVSGLESAEAIDGESLRGGRIYVAPGDFHMTVSKERTDAIVRLSKAPPVNFCRPAVDPMLRSVATSFGARALVLILTGMGHDGLHGCEAVVTAGGTVIAQDEATSVVWGMPGAVATSGLCSAVLPVSKIGPYIDNFGQGLAA